MVGKLHKIVPARASMAPDDAQPARQSRGTAASNKLTLTLTLTLPPPPQSRPLPVHSRESPLMPLTEASAGPFGSLKRRLAHTPPGGPVVTIRPPSGRPPRHPTPALGAVADELDTAGAERSSVDGNDVDDDGVVLHSMTVSHRDWLQYRTEELGIQRARLRQTLNDWSWSPGDSCANQTALGILMNMRMAANPRSANAAVRQAGIRHLLQELSRVDRELAALAQLRAVALLTRSPGAL